MIISVASGKGGTGKTTVATNLALSLAEDLPLSSKTGASAIHPVRNSALKDDKIDISNGVQFLDCDVEEPNAHIFLKPQIEKSLPVSIPVPEIDESKCNFCGKCAEVCAYNAIAVISAKGGSTSGGKDKVLVFKELCHGCGGCALLCPQKAISEAPRDIGVVEIGDSKNIQFIHGKLNIGEAMATPLIRAVKERANHSRNIIVDVPPGTSCPVIEAVKGSDFCILVTEPTPFGLNDLRLAVEVLKKLKIPFAVIVNQFDIGDERVDRYCQDENISILMRIPFSKEIASAYSNGVPIVEAQPQYREEFKKLFEAINPSVRKK